MWEGYKIRYVLLGLVLFGCRDKEAVADRLHFTKIDADKTGIDFTNTITESDSVNMFLDEYTYNGSGVGVGDFNKDGLPDLFFCGGMVSSRLYINQGNLQFKDVTISAGLETMRWCTGVSVVDINGDGFPDIYVCVSHSGNAAQRKNLLFINDGALRDGALRDTLHGAMYGTPHFTEQAEAYGLADTGFSTQAAFFDYDKDGDLDMYLLNHDLYKHTANDLRPRDTSGFAAAQDRLYRNDGVPAGGSDGASAGMSHPVFHEVSAAAGIKEDGYGLGLVITDVNGDGWPDVYVANDFLANDLLWLNNRNGTFSNVIGMALRHQCYNSMGADAADINNDGLPDLAVVDMLPETNERKKMMGGAASQNKFDMQQRWGYQPSFVRNMLQLNNGNRRDVPYFSEIGQLAGIFQTDWSWSVLMADLDNDGWKDIHITNGLGKDVTNNDYASFTSAQGGYTGNYSFSTGGHADPRTDHKDMNVLRRKLDAYGSVKMDSYIFHNNGDLTFSDVSEAAGFDVPAISNGAVYADLDNDGDLDLVVNTINEPAFVWRNDIRKCVAGGAQDVAGAAHNFLGLCLEGPAGNRDGFGVAVTLFDHGNRQFLEQSPVRGFSSCVDQRLFFGVGAALSVDSVVVRWPDEKVQVLRQVKANQYLQVRYGDAAAGVRAVQATGVRAEAMIGARATPARMEPLFDDVSDKYGIDFKHKETAHYDFGDHQPILQKYSQLGPCIATGDVNGDGLEDFFVGGAANQSGKIFIQRPGRVGEGAGGGGEGVGRVGEGAGRGGEGPGGKFESTDLVSGIKSGEDLGAIFFDADGDKDLDLLVTGGSSEFAVKKYNQPRLYLNDGKGHFTLAEDALPPITDVTKAIAVADIDGDGDLDVFIGGRVSPDRYPQSPRSYLLRNDHGKFTDVTKEVCGQLLFPGMITDAVFADFDGDRQTDLVVCGEWMGIRFFRGVGGSLTEVTDNTGLDHMQGLWRCIRAVDVDKDGDIDFVVGNTGLNNRYGVSPSRPMKLFAKDMDNNGSDELIPAYYIKGASGGRNGGSGRNGGGGRSGRSGRNGGGGDYQLYPALDRNQLAQEIPAVKKKYLLHKDFSTVTMARLIDDFGAGGWTELTCETAASVWLENRGGGKFSPHVLPVQAQFAPVNCIVAADVDGDARIDLILAGNEYQAEANTGRSDASYGLLLKGDGRGGWKPIDGTRSGLFLDGDIRDMKIVRTKDRGNLLLAAPNDDHLISILIKPYEK
ncbi:MAG TPA: VCBS repeat-containing protein [Puia sp.]|jgi:hypothetical protein